MGTLARGSSHGAQSEGLLPTEVVDEIEIAARRCARFFQVVTVSRLSQKSGSILKTLPQSRGDVRAYAELFPRNALDARSWNPAGLGKGVRRQIRLQELLAQPLAGMERRQGATTSSIAVGMAAFPSIYRLPQQPDGLSRRDNLL
jgi:hypothetical protein